MKVAFLGERGSFSELAACEFFGDDIEPDPQKDFADIALRVQKGKAAYGIVPIENSRSGSIHQNYDMLLEHEVYVCGEIYLYISHYLLACPGVSRQRITTVYSHPQIFLQCRKYFNRYTDLQQQPVSNSAKAVRKVMLEKRTDAAAIASMQAAIDYNMTILAKNIEDNHHNMTRFIIIQGKKQKKMPEGKDVRNSIVFSTRNIPGALFKCLSVFSLRDINLLKIESRPYGSKGFNYLFYLDFEGSMKNASHKNALRHLQEITSFYRFLGSYPKGRKVRPVYKKRVS